jgi:hypothetical protein
LTFGLCHRWNTYDATLIIFLINSKWGAKVELVPLEIKPAKLTSVEKDELLETILPGIVDSDAEFVHVQDSLKGYVYSACAALLDLENPQIEIARLPYPLFKPEFVWELKGEVNNVCFPTGSVVFDDKLYIYYGAADKLIAAKSLNLAELLSELKKSFQKHGKSSTK